MQTQFQCSFFFIVLFQRKKKRDTANNSVRNQSRSTKAPAFAVMFTYFFSSLSFLFVVHVSGNNDDGDDRKKNCTDERKRKGKRAHIRKKEKKRNLPILGFYSLSFFLLLFLLFCAYSPLTVLVLWQKTKRRRGVNRREKRKSTK